MKEDALEARGGPDEILSDNPYPARLVRLFALVRAQERALAGRGA